MAFEEPGVDDIVGIDRDHVVGGARLDRGLVGEIDALDPVDAGRGRTLLLEVRPEFLTARLVIGDEDDAEIGDLHQKSRPASEAGIAPDGRSAAAACAAPGVKPRAAAIDA